MMPGQQQQQMPPPPPQQQQQTLGAPPMNNFGSSMVQMPGGGCVPNFNHAVRRRSEPQEQAAGLRRRGLRLWEARLDESGMGALLARGIEG